MGVDFYTCQNPDCGYNFPDCGDYFSCECGYNFCSAKCGQRQSSQDDVEENDDDCDQDDEEYDEVTSCMFCREQDAPDGNLLGALLTHYNLSREDAVKIYYAQQKEEG